MEIVIAGAGGAGLKVVQIIDDFIASGSDEFSILGFVDDNRDIINTDLCGYPVLGTPEDLIEGRLAIRPSSNVGIACPIGDPEARKRMLTRLAAVFENIPNLIHPSAQISRNATLGRGNIFSQNVVIQPAVKIGDFNAFNIASIMGPQSEIGDYCTVNANVMIAGESKVGSFTYIGMGAKIKQRLQIGEHCKIGANTFVAKSLEERVTILGVPARRIGRSDGRPR